MAAPRPKITTDKIFDGLAEKFRRNVYGTSKGWLRQQILFQDLQQIPGLNETGTVSEHATISVMDVGGGLGQMSDWLAQQGHQVCFTEPADDMRAEASALFDHQQSQNNYHYPVQVHNLRLQQITEQLPPADLVVCHAVLEWLHEPEKALSYLNAMINPGGWLSLMFFNEHGLRLSNIVKGNYDKALRDTLDGTGQRLRLTPISPQDPDTVLKGLADQGLEIISVAGIRVFSDYLRDKEPDQADMDKVLELEWRYCHQEPYWRLGRYIHVIARKAE
ncbi:methyltransferase domain-containing protein [Oceanospirillum sediminis]|uniref:tRNA 5-carboxymethoxyuridine methyltransferase n=1 Tax=Oceanospirillum sediminis TaxID=2760088 RepID=A0A839ILT3_9GAMM|nr:methyltransferase domain-containing protein [Oceanospirillum sediminis]MBB1485286.1 methyltransferase domain-containing protein [Oceanospirillum sediminis]